MLDRGAGSQGGSEIGRLLDAINPAFVTCSLLVIAAVVLILGHKDGIHLVVPALIAVLVGGVVNVGSSSSGSPTEPRPKKRCARCARSAFAQAFASFGA